MSDDGRVIDGEIVETLPIVAGVRSGDDAYAPRSDRAREMRPTRPTLLKAKTAVAVDRGARSIAAAIIESGGSPATAHNPTANGFTFERIYADKQALFPNAPTNKVIAELSKAKVVERLRAPDVSEAFLAATYKASNDAVREGDGEDSNALSPIERHRAQRHISVIVRRALRRAAQLVERVGLDAALVTLADYERSERSRWPRIRQTRELSHTARRFEP